VLRRAILLHDVSASDRQDAVSVRVLEEAAASIGVPPERIHEALQQIHAEALVNAERRERRLRMARLLGHGALGAFASALSAGGMLVVAGIGLILGGRIVLSVLLPFLTGSAEVVDVSFLQDATWPLALSALAVGGGTAMKSLSARSVEAALGGQPQPSPRERLRSTLQSIGNADA
jgi:hypothetical protein